MSLARCFFDELAGRLFRPEGDEYDVPAPRLFGQLAEAMFGLVELGYDLWWRGDVAGVRNVPAHGGALLVVNRVPIERRGVAKVLR